MEDMCIHKSGSTATVYGNLSELCNSLVETRVCALLGQTTVDHWRFLIAVEKIWQHHCEVMGLIRNIFLYLDRSYALQTNGVLSIWEMGLSHFKKHLTSNVAVCC